jgi:membrane-bound lytic murein transglycosylase D
MKYFAALFACALIGGCSLTQNVANESDALIDNEPLNQTCSDIQSTIEHDADTCAQAQEGVVAIVHPTEVVDIPLGDTETLDADMPIDNVWERVRASLNFEVPNQRRVTVQKNWYLKHPAYMQRVSKRATPFLYYIVEELEKNDMPLELALLPIVESAFDPFAYSHGRAAGMWQFIPGTGKNYGMKQTWWYDGRRDVIASTEGAIKYLKRLHKMFDGDWLHALASYNSGEGRVMRAIRKNKRQGKPTDFWSLNLPRETEAYVPKLLALAEILKNQEDYDFDWPTIQNKPVIEVVDVGSQIDLAMAAKLAGLTTEELHALNPGYNRWATDPEGPHRLVLPLAVADTFRLALQQTSEKDRLNWVRHKVKSGESLGLIARKYHTTTDVIKKINGMRNSTIYANDHILVPIALKSLEDYSLSADQRLARKQAQQQGAHKLTHKVVSGDTFWDLSREYKVNMRKLAKWNGMAPTDPLIPGKNLVVWVNQISSQQTDNSVMRTLTYTVRNGDSLSRIANKFKVKVSDITKWNSLNSKKFLQPGQKLRLYVDVTRT